MMGSSLADYLWGDKKDGFTGFYGQASTGTYSLSSDISGKTRVPTMADVAAAEKPEDKLTLLQQLADVVNIRADAAISTGRADNVAGMAQSAKEMLAALKQVVDGLKTSDGSVAEGEADPKLEAYSKQIGSALDSLRTAMDKISSLSGRASGEVASQISTDLTAMDDVAGDLATLAGTDWRRSGTTFRPDPTKLVDMLV
ncbi:MAG: hypothetical protein NVV74_25130 [Magnetospirillum sp.]|nr:hypothetical protein [Magnetospirillum sp.]